MKIIPQKIVCLACSLLLVLVAGCVAPPEETISGPVDLYDPNQFASTTTASPDTAVLVEATPFQTTAIPTLAYSNIQQATPIPEDMVCLIFFKEYDWAFESNKTAKNINLVNPPLYINYTIKKPFNVTGTKIFTDKSGKDQTIQTSYYSPYAYLEFSIRDPVTGEIFQQDGFGKGYGTMTNKTIQVTKPGNLLIEIGGNNVTPSLGIWVKPAGNIDEALVNVSNLECWPQDSVKRLGQ